MKTTRIFWFSVPLRLGESIWAQVVSKSPEEALQRLIDDDPIWNSCVFQWPSFEVSGERSRLLPSATRIHIWVQAATI